MKNTIESELNAQLRLQEETLSDGSRVYSIFIGKYEIPAEDYAWAEGAFMAVYQAALKLEQRNRGEI